jgi:nickel-dependent lactate racemase
MKLTSKNRSYELELDLSKPNVMVAKPHVSHEAGTFAELMKKALDNPVGAERLESIGLAGKKIAVIVDDWARPTPAYEFIPEIIARLEKAGATDENICFVTASGMHDPMSEADLRRKLGDDTVNRFFCHSHDSGSREHLSFVGITEMGTPVWVNKYVAEADFVIAVGRVYPHIAYGYEGGYKMIVPGVASNETILRDHGMNFSSRSVYGNVKRNPSRDEADAVGRLVGIEYLINYVIGFDKEPHMAFAGRVESVFKECVKYGEEKVWATRIGKKADITILCAGDEADRGIEENPTYYVGLALDVTKPDGIIIVIMDEAIQQNKRLLEGIDLGALSDSELIYLHEKRNWTANDRDVQSYVKSIRSEYYDRYVMCMHPQNMYIVADTFSPAKLARYNAQRFDCVNAALEYALKSKPGADILVIPEGRTTFPIEEYSFVE